MQPIGHVSLSDLEKLKDQKETIHLIPVSTVAFATPSEHSEPIFLWDDMANALGGACMAMGLPDSTFESLLNALKEQELKT